MKKRLTIEEHRAAGLEMKNIYRALINLKIKYCAAYPRKTSPALPLAAAIKALMEARALAENRLCEDYPKEVESKIYFGPLPDDLQKKEDLR